ncbi:MAG: hypothetical protein ACYCS1_05425 [Gammaproteobacteria bacterium]
MNNEEEQEEKKFAEELKQIPTNKKFPLVKIERIPLPHYYTITPKHLEYNGGRMYLNIEEVEKRSNGKAVCDRCRINYEHGKQPKILSYSEHEIAKTLFIQVEQNKDLDKIKGLKEYLMKIKPISVKLGIQRFAFPCPSQINE